MNSAQFLTHTLFSFLVCGCINGDAKCFPEHRSLLLKLKHGFTLSQGELASWEPSSDCCNWEGIACDSKSGHIIALDLGGRNITGSINSDALFGLTSLHILDLSNNQFDGISIPQPGFEKLKELWFLDLSDAGFVGQIPIGISRLAGLYYLDLSVCHPLQTGILELRNPNFSTMIRNLNKLGVLRLGCVDLHQDVEWLTALVTSMPHLEALDLSQANLTGSLSQELFQLKALEHLDLTANYHISGGLPDFPKGSALEYMSLSYMNISGTIPESFGNLKNLTEVSLTINKLTGVIPASIGKLVKLTWLDLSDNGLTGPVPEFLFSLPLLEHLSLSFNQLSGELDSSLNASTSFREILLNGNQLRGQIPPSFFYLPSLEHLVLGQNKFSGAIEPDRIAILNNLEILDLSYNSLSLEEFNNNNFLSFPNLKELNLAWCGLTKVPTFLKNQTKMERMDLSNNRIGPDIPWWMWSSIGDSLYLSHNLFTNIEGSEDISMSRLRVLDLHSNMLHGSIPVPPPFAWFVDFSNNSFSSTITPEVFFNLSQMGTTFSAANNNLNGEIPPSICNATTLSTLDLSNNLFSGLIPSCLLEIGTLNAMNLGRNRLQGTIPRNITRPCGLSSLILSDNHLEGSLPRSLVYCSDLTVLDLGNNHIADTFPFWLGDNPSLQVLSLRSNRFYGPLGPSESQEKNCMFPGLQVFDLSSNNFSGKLSPMCFSGLRLMMNKLDLTSSPLYKLGDGPSYEINIAVIKGQEVPLLNIFYKVVDFSNNSFEGDIPPVIGGLRDLNVLNLSYNSLTGDIPCELGNLMQLQSLDLSTNHLSGEIPQCLTSLTFLEWLDLSNNNLAGRIPRDRQFSTFSNSSFQENPGLCGIPLSKQCGNAIPNTTNAMPPAVISDHSSSSSSYVIMLGLFVGLGFGVGIAVVLVLLNVPLKCLRESR